MATATEPMAPMQDYFSLPGLSHSGMCDLAVSPLRYWHRQINPEREKEEPTPAMVFGSALHCAVLEPDTFLDRYASEVNIEDYPGCMVTIDDMRTWMRDHGLTPKGTRKAELVEQVHAVDASAPILEVIERRHFAQHQGKTILPVETWKRVYGAAESLLAEPKLKEILAHGRAEVPLFATDPETGVALKGKLDWISDTCILDVKTFSQQRGKSIDKSVTDAIWYEGYYRQAVFYAILRGWPKTWDGDVVLAFVESEPPYEVRLRSLRSKCGGNATVYWSRALIEIRAMIRDYAEMKEKFGEKMWRYARSIEAVADEELPGVNY